MVDRETSLQSYVDIYDWIVYFFRGVKRLYSWFFPNTDQTECFRPHGQLTLEKLIEPRQYSFNEREYPSYVNLKIGLNTPNCDPDTLLGLFRHVMEHNNAEMSHSAICLVLEHASGNPNFNRFKKVMAEFVPFTRFRQEVLVTLYEIPEMFFKSPSTIRYISAHLADIMQAENLMSYQDAKNHYGDILILFPSGFANGAFDDVMSEKERLKFLSYLEFVIRPKLQPFCLSESNEMYARMARRVNRFNMEDFMKIVLKSTSYSYYSVLTALTGRASDGSLSLNDAIDFMQEKKIICDNREEIGIVSTDLKNVLEVDFVLALLSTKRMHSTDRLMRVLKEKDLVNEKLLRHIAKSRIAQLNPIYGELDMNPVEKLSTQCALTEFCKSERHHVLSLALLLDFASEFMNVEQKKMYYAIIACQSHPKTECNETGSSGFFRKLFKRLLELIPPMNVDDVDLDFCEFESVLFCIYNLYTINDRLKTIMFAVDENWKDKILHVVDMLVVTSANLLYLGRIEQDEERQLEMRHRQNVVTNAGQILVFLFGTLNTTALNVAPRSVSRLEIHKDFTFANSYSSEYIIRLTNTPASPDLRISFPHRRRAETSRQQDENDVSDDNDDNDEVEEDNAVEEGEDDNDDAHVDVEGADDNGEDDEEDHDDDDEGHEDESNSSSIYSEYTLVSDIDDINEDDTEEEASYRYQNMMIFMYYVFNNREETPVHSAMLDLFRPASRRPSVPAYHVSSENGRINFVGRRTDSNGDIFDNNEEDVGDHDD